MLPMRAIALLAPWLLAAAAVAQEPDLAVAGLFSVVPPSEPKLTNPEWLSQTQLDHEYAALRHEREANEFVVVFAHTSVDPTTPEGQLMLLEYPFLATPEAGWNHGHTALANVRAVADLDGTDQLVVPPERLAAHLELFLACTTDPQRELFGTKASTTGAEVFAWCPPAGLSTTDERKAWSGPRYDDSQVFDVADVGARAMILAAYRAYPGADAQALEAIRALLAYDYGFRIHVQAAIVSLQGPRPRIKFSQSCVMRRLTLMQSPSPCTDARHSRRLVLPTNHQVWAYIARRGGWLDVEFQPGSPPPYAPQGTIAFFETTTGWAQVPQAPPFPCSTHLARYAFPTNALSGFFYVALPGIDGGPPTFLLPVGANPVTFALSVRALN
jgi:hypothetical protein